MYRQGAVHRFVAGQLERVERGEIDRLMLFCPPRSGKTELLVRFAAWCLGRHPDWPMLYTSYGADLAWEKSGEARAVVASEEFGQLWPGVRLNPSSRSVQRWRIDGQRGGLQAQGVGGPLTGKGGRLVLIDDPVKNRQEADSATLREATWRWYTSTLRTRLEPQGRMVLVMTRWHEDDLAGRLLRRAAEEGLADQWVVVKLPAVASAGIVDGVDGDPLGRRPGEALDPTRYDVAALGRIKASIGSRDWTALYQQEPRQDEGNVFKRSWLQYVDALPVLKRTVIAWDTAYESGESSDYSVALLVGRGLVDGRFYVMPLLRERLEFPELVRAGQGIVARYPQAEQIVEARASGRSLRQQLRSDGIPLIDVEPAGDKVARANSVTRWFEADMVRFVLGPGVDALEHELLMFPAGEHDDQVDALVYGLQRLTAPAAVTAVAGRVVRVAELGL